MPATCFVVPSAAAFVPTRRALALKIVQIAIATALAMASLCSSTSRAQSTNSFDEASVAALFANLVEHPEKLRGVQESFYGQLSDRLSELMTSAHISVLSDPAYATYVSRRVSDFLETGVTARAVILSFAVFGDAWLPGLRRLPADRQEELYKATTALWRWLAANDRPGCRALAVESPDGSPIPTTGAATAAAIRFYEANPDAAEDFLFIAAEAILAEVHAVSVRPLVAGLEERAAMQAHLAAARVRAEALRTTATLWDPKDARCEAQRVIAEAMWDISPADRAIVIHAYTLAVSDPTLMNALLADE